MSTTLNVLSLGGIVGNYRLPYRLLRRAVAELGIEPALSINNAPLFDEAQVEAIRQCVEAMQKGRKHTGTA